MAGPTIEDLVKSFQLDATASVDLNIYRFVVQVGESTVKQADAAAAQAVGVSGAPLLLTDRDRGNSGGKTVPVIMEGIPLVELGTGGATLGALITCDNVGKGVVATTTQRVLGVAQKAGNAGDLVPVQLRSPAIPAAAP